MKWLPPPRVPSCCARPAAEVLHRRVEIVEAVEQLLHLRPSGRGSCGLTGASCACEAHRDGVLEVRADRAEALREIARR